MTSRLFSPCRRQNSLIAALLFASIAQNGGAQPASQSSPCSLSASAVYEVLVLQAQFAPIRTQQDFAEFQRTLDFYCFKKTNNITWTFYGSSGQVAVMSRPNQGSISIVLLPDTPVKLGDAALAALINRATQISASDGDAIDLELPSRTIVAKGATAKLTESLGFRLNDGQWFRTSALFDWSP